MTVEIGTNVLLHNDLTAYYLLTSLIELAE